MGDLVTPRGCSTSDDTWYRELYRDRTPCLVIGVRPLHNEWTDELEDDLIEILYKKELKYMRAGSVKVVSGA